MILATLLVFVDLLLFVLHGLILVRIIIGWVLQPGQAPRFSQMLADLTEPVINPLRRVLPRSEAFDFAPLVTLLLFDVARAAMYYLIFSR